MKEADLRVVCCDVADGVGVEAAVAELDQGGQPVVRRVEVEGAVEGRGGWGRT